MRKLFFRIQSVISRGMLYLMGIGAVSFVFEACYGTPTDSQFNRNYTIKGKLLLENGQAAGNLEIKAASSSGISKAYTASDGSFEINLNGFIHEKVLFSAQDGLNDTIVVLPAEQESLNIEWKQ